MNNKGFAITTVLYGTLILFLMLFLSMLGLLSSFKDRISMLVEKNKGTRDIINGIYVSDADSLLITLNGRNYYKANDGEALLGYVYAGGFTGPVLVGTTADSVAYYTSYDSNVVLSSSGSFVQDGVTYYYSSSIYWMEGNYNNTSTFNRVKYDRSAFNVGTSIVNVAETLLEDR